MKKINFLLIAISALLTFSCKKKENTPDNTATTNPTSTLNYYGLLYSKENASVISGTLFAGSGSSTAYFPTGGFINTASISEGWVGSAVNVGTISLNSVAFKSANQSGNIMYNDSTYSLFNSPLSWSVSGGNGISAFNYTYTATRPSYTGYNTLPDTIKLSQNKVMNFTGVTGADEIVISLLGGSGYLNKVISGSSTSVTFTSGELSGLTPSSTSFMTITFNKSTIVNIGGKDFKFKTGYQLFKQIVTQ